MNVVIDTSVWSLCLRRRKVDQGDPHVATFRHCIEEGHGLVLVGPILQELLSGLRSKRQFSSLLAVLRPVPITPVDRATYVLAAEMSNACRSEGIQAGSVDFLIAAACVQSGLPLLTSDRDFDRIASVTDLVLVPTVCA